MNYPFAFAILPFIVFACNKPEQTQISKESDLPDTRSFFMGFTAFPYDLTAAAINETYANVSRDGDIYLNHLDHGVPWNEALDGDPFPQEVQQTLEEAVNAKGTNQKFFLTATATNQERTGLANYWNNDGTHQPLLDQWRSRTFDDPLVIQAYLNYCKRIIDVSNPDYFAYGIEINSGFLNNMQEFEAYLVLADSVYRNLKELYPNLPIMLTFQDQAFNKSRSELLEITKSMLPFSDYIAISSYPFWQYDFPGRDANPALLQSDWLADFRLLAPDKPFAISEGGYIAEDLIMDSFGVRIKGTEDWQRDYLDKLLNHANDLNAEFICWFVYRDYDRLYETFPTDIMKIWRDTGLLDGDGNTRPAYDRWLEWKDLPK